MTLRQRIKFYQQLSMLVRAGLPIRASIARLKEKLPCREVTLLSQQLESGARLGEAFGAAGFTSFETHLVAAGERSAQLETVFDHLGQFWTREVEMRQALVRPLYYPFVVLHLALLLGAGVQLVQSDVMAAVTQLVLSLVALYVVCALVYALVRMTWSSPSLRRFWLFLPIIGSALKSAAAYRWISALRLEFGAGISLYRAVGDAWRASGYINAEQFAAEGEAAMLAGERLSALVTRWRQLPRDWIDFIETGEISGAIEASFKNLEDEAKRNWSLAQARMTEWIPKIVYFFVLLIVAAQVGRVMYLVEVKPMIDAQEQIDKAVEGR